MFKDDEFPPEAKSLGGDDASAEWMRLSELADNPQLFVDGAENGDVVQGKSGDNYFLGALAAIATHNNLVESLVSAANVAAGSYEVTFWRGGLMQKVMVDDFVPVKEAKKKKAAAEGGEEEEEEGGDPEEPAGKLPLYGRCRNPQEIWVPVVEKAYAKLLGSYANIAGGFMDEALVDLTGGYSSSFAVKDMDAETLWEQLLRVEAEKLLACATAKLPLAESQKFADEKGVRNRRAYFVLNAVESKAAGRMVHVRNPWGTLEWKGKFADESSDWTPALKNELKYEFGADGTWWMHYDDFKTTFTDLTTCELLVQAVKDDSKYRVYSQELSWEGDLAGGPINNHDSWMFNPQVGVEATGDVDLVCVLSQQDPRGPNGRGGELYGIGLHGVKVLNSRLALWAAVAPDFTSGEYEPKREVVCRVQLKAGENVILVPSTYQAKQEGKFSLQVFASEPVKVMTIDSHPEDGRSTPQEWAEITSDGLGKEHSAAADVAPVDVDHIGTADFKLDGRRKLNGLDLKALEKETLDKCGDGLYEDDDFPCTDKSLGGPDEVVWLRPGEFKPDYALFVGGSDEGDIVQGALGDCWFLGSLACVSTRIDLMQNLFLVARPDKGFYIFGFWKNGEWKVVTIDDRIPCSKSTRLPKYGRGQDPREVWVPLIEKAYANLHGTYHDLPGGLMAEALPDLTGGVGDQRNFKRDNMDGEAVWAFIQRALEEGWLSGTSATSEKRSAGEGKEEDEFGVGILTGHAYSVVDAKDCSDVGATRLIRLRNPWGGFEWTGPYSDDSKEWTPELKKKLSYEFGDDGTFWIPLDEYMKYYTDISCCRMYLDATGAVWKQYVKKGEWTSENSAGSINEREPFLKNPMYGITASEKTKVVCSLYQDDTRMRLVDQTAHKELHPTGITMYEVDDCTQRMEELKGKTAAFKPMYEPLRESLCEFELEAGQHRLLVASTYKPGLTGKYTFLVYSEKPVTFYDLNGGDAEEVPETAN